MRLYIIDDINEDINKINSNFIDISKQYNISEQKINDVSDLSLAFENISKETGIRLNTRDINDRSKVNINFLLSVALPP